MHKKLPTNTPKAIREMLTDEGFILHSWPKMLRGQDLRNRATSGGEEISEVWLRERN